MNNKLIPPCTYQGGKQRYAKQIVDIMFKENNICENTKFYDLCCGSGAITLEIINRGISPQNIIMVDNSMWGYFWKHIGDGTFNIDKFNECILTVPNDKSLVKSYVDELAAQTLDEYRLYNYLILQSCSFGGKQVDTVGLKWKHCGFRNYWQPTETSIRKSPVNPMQPSKDELLRRVSLLCDKCLGVKCINDDLNKINFSFKKEDIIYIDPPYLNTTGYNYNFNIVDFCNKYTGNKFYISEKTPFSQRAICLNLTGAKGGITAKKKKRDEEWLSVVNF